MANKYGLRPINEEPSVNKGGFNLSIESIPNQENKYGLRPIEEKINPNILKRIPGAIGTIASDIGNVAASLPGKIVKGIGNIPQDIEYLKQNIPEAGRLITNKPLEAGKEALAGLTEFAGKISRVPPALVDYLAHIGMIKPETAKEFPRPFSGEEVTNLVNQAVGKETSGGKLIRGGFRNLENVVGGAKLAQLANPLKYTNKSIAKDVLKTREKQMAIHDTEYNKLWKKAEKQGFNKVPIEANKINLDIIKKNANSKYYDSLKNLIDNPTLKNAQKAQSDLGKLINGRELNKDILLSEEQATKKAAIDAQNYIKDRMFRNEKNQINLPLKKRYDVITKSYGKNVIPYTTNKAINEFRRGDLLAKELIPRLEKGKFAARKGKAHPEISRRQIIPKIAKYGLGGEVLAHLLGIDKLIIDKLLNKNGNE